MASNLNSVQEFYKDKTVFITGGSGFMGKVLVEKLLYSCSEVKELILLMRQKRGKSATQRVLDFSNLPMFKRIMDEKPEVMRKIKIVNGEILENNLGLSESDLSYVVNNAHIVFHLAASLKLEATLRPNILANLTATKKVIDLSKKMTNLLAFVHVSTAFCNVDRDEIEEKVYTDIPYKPVDLIQAANVLTDKQMEKVQNEYLGKHPNTYTFTKRMAEILIHDEYLNGNLPICIVRPSIVGSTLKEPVEGWVDSLNGPPGIIMAASKGVLRCMMIDRETVLNMIPCDLSINAFIMIAKQIGTMTQKPKTVPVYHLVTHESHKLKYGVIIDVIEEMRYKCPPAIMLWYPNTVLTRNEYYYKFNVFFFQLIPAYVVDFLFAMFGQKRFLVKVQNMIAVGMDVVKCFTTTDWIFHSDNFQNLTKIQSREEQEMFDVETKTIDIKEYVRKGVFGGRVYTMRDPLSTIPRGRRLMVFLLILDKAVKFFFLYWLVTKFLDLTGLTEPAMRMKDDLVSKIF